MGMTTTLALSRAAWAEGGDREPELIEWDTLSERPIAILVPDHPAGARLPVVVALHGHGETQKAPLDGALGWPRDYALQRAMSRVAHPPLSTEDYEGLITDDALTAANVALSTHPFAGVIVVCPRVPPMSLYDDDTMDAYGVWLAETLLPRVRTELPVLGSAASTGIDGVSLGGALALKLGFAHPDVFGAVGALQPAIGKDSGPKLEEWLRGARTHGDVPFRLTTSSDDYYRDAVRAVHAYLVDASLPHDFTELVGPHDYPFNRGPGAYELLLWHDRNLAR